MLLNEFLDQEQYCGNILMGIMLHKSTDGGFGKKKKLKASRLLFQGECGPMQPTCRQVAAFFSWGMAPSQGPRAGLCWLAGWALRQTSPREWKTTLLSPGITSSPDTRATLFMSPLGKGGVAREEPVNIPGQGIWPILLLSSSSTEIVL